MKTPAGTGAGKVTLQDVAAAAGVSPATASRVLGKEHAHLVRAEIQEQVRAAARRLQYRPDYHASALRRGSSRTIALLMHPNELPISVRRLSAIERAVWERGYDTMTLRAGAGIPAELEELRRLTRYRVDGAIYSGSPEPEVEGQLVRLDTDVPVVTLFPVPGNGLDCVTVDRRHGAYLAARHLFGLGHRRLGALLGRLYPSMEHGLHPTIQHRLEGIRRACEEAGCPFDDRLVARTEETSYAAGYVGARRLWERAAPPPTALLCSNDQVAIGALRAFQELGVRVPEDAAVVGFDNLPEGAYARVPLTTLEQPVEQEARRAVEHLFARLGQPSERREVTTISLPPVLVVRESCGARLQDSSGSTSLRPRQGDALTSSGGTS